MGLFSAIATSGLSGIADYFGQQATNQANRDIAGQTNLTQRQIAEQNNALQREFAQHGIQWKVEDAAKAGISPLAAIGASDPGFTPTSYIPATPEFKSPISNIGKSIREMGQDIQRAQMAAQSPHDRAMERLNEIHAMKQNDLLDEQILASRWSRLGINQPSNPAVPSVKPGYQLGRNVDGSIDVWPSAEIAYTHPDYFSKLGWYVDNRVIPSISELYQNLAVHPTIAQKIRSYLRRN